MKSKNKKNKRSKKTIKNLNSKQIKNKRSKKTITSLNLNQTNNIESIDVYKLFINNKFKTLYEHIEAKPLLLNNIINDNKTIIHYSIQTNNFKLLKKLISLDSNVILKKTSSNEYLQDIALDSGFDNIFFYLVDQYIQTSKDNLLFDSLTINVIIKKNWDLLKKFIDKYNKYINWLNILNSYSYLYMIVNIYYTKLPEIIQIFKPIIQQYIDNKKDPTNLFKYPLEDNSLFFLLYLYYKPEELTQNNQSIKKFKLDKQTLMDYIKLFPDQLNYPNQVNKISIYYMAESNDIELLKFSIKLGANVNHISPLGYSNFCHHIMKYSNKKTIEYVLTLEMNFNHLDSNNESPIYNLLRNTNSNDSIDIISSLLNKTLDWDMQNMYGQSIMHLLVIRPDIEKFYNLLKQRYFDINLKNKVGTSVIQALEYNFKNQKLKTDIISKKIIEFKELLVDNYIKIVSETESIDIPIDIKSNCTNYNIKDPARMKTSCWISTMNNLSKSSLTDIDKLSKNYLDLIIDDYQFAHYNLYNARDPEIYIYYQILISKHSNLGFPLNDKTFDPKKIMSFSKITLSNNDIQ